MLATSQLTEFSASSLIEAFQQTLDWTTTVNDGGTFWYRGVKNAELDLEPGAYWRQNYRELDPLLDFVQEAGTFATVGELNEWKTYYLAQHHGIPTRLLDWTESFTAALFFALDKWDGSSTPCVWVVRPERINKISVGWEGVISPEQNSETSAWLPYDVEKGSRKIVSGEWIYDSALPLAIFPRKNNTRIVAQQGMFTVHGTKRLKLNDWLIAEEPDHAKVICKVCIKGLARNEALKQLNALGVRRHNLYPDLTNYVEYLKDYWSW